MTYGATGREYVAKDCRVVESHTTIRCTTAVGVGYNLQWVVNVGNLTSETPTTTYASPSIFEAHVVSSEEAAEECAIAGACHNRTTARTQGGDFLVLFGGNFGSIEEDAVASITYGKVAQTTGVPALCEPPACPCEEYIAALQPYMAQLALSEAWQYSTAECSVIQDHEVVVCTMPSGVGHCMLVQIVVGGLRSQLSPVYTGYACPCHNCCDVPGPGGRANSRRGECLCDKPLSLLACSSNATCAMNPSG